jgi:hypothetical protein
MGIPEHYQLYLVYTSMARELGFCVCHPVPSTLQGLRVSRLLEQFILGEEALWRALVPTHHTPLGLYVRYVLGLLLHHRPYSTLRRRDNTDDRNGFESIFFQQRYVRLCPYVVALGTPPLRRYSRRKGRVPCQNTDQLLTSMASFSSPTTSNMRDPC